jgi:hypothetical protein
MIRDPSSRCRVVASNVSLYSNDEFRWVWDPCLLLVVVWSPLGCFGLCCCRCCCCCCCCCCCLPWLIEEEDDAAEMAFLFGNVGDPFEGVAVVAWVVVGEALGDSIISGSSWTWIVGASFAVVGLLLSPTGDSARSIPTYDDDSRWKFRRPDDRRGQLKKARISAK